MAEDALENTVFDEVVYGVQPFVSLDEVYPKVRSCLENFLASDRFAWLTQVAINTSGDWLIEPPGFGETRLEELKAYFKVDFLFPVEDAYYIIDWKSGKVDSEKHRKQLLGYTTWAAYHYELNPGEVRPVIAYLYPDYREEQASFTGEDLENFAVQVRAETYEMYEYCRDVEQNIPLDKREFPLVDNERICSYCNYRGVCFPERYPYTFD
jgi:hypothetical protein